MTTHVGQIGPPADNNDTSDTNTSMRITPHALWPTDNAYGIPSLLPHLQADALDLPVIPWGRRRRDRIHGTVHFYTDDYRFTALWKHPDQVVHSACISAIEPNFSCSSQTPRAVALHLTYQKRWLARYWQSKGIRIFVDLHVAPEHRDVNLLGVPAGWAAFATRGYTETASHILDDYEIATEIAGDEGPLFVVYGGGRLIQELCLKHNFIHIPEHSDLHGHKRLITVIGDSGTEIA